MIAFFSGDKEEITFIKAVAENIVNPSLDFFTYFIFLDYNYIKKTENRQSTKSSETLTTHEQHLKITRRITNLMPQCHFQPSLHIPYLLILNKQQTILVKESSKKKKPTEKKTRREKEQIHTSFKHFSYKCRSKLELSLEESPCNQQQKITTT